MQKMTKGTNLETDDFNELVANCENEALHLSGQIQGFGGAFFIDILSLKYPSVISKRVRSAFSTDYSR